MRRGGGRGAGTPNYGTTFFSRPSTSLPAFALGIAKLISSVSRRERCAGRKERTLRFRRESKKIKKGSAPGSAFCPLLCSCPRARSARPPVVHLSSIQRTVPDPFLHRTRSSTHTSDCQLQHIRLLSFPTAISSTPGPSLPDPPYAPSASSLSFLGNKGFELALSFSYLNPPTSLSVMDHQGLDGVASSSTVRSLVFERFLPDVLGLG